MLVSSELVASVTVLSFTCHASSVLYVCTGALAGLMQGPRATSLTDGRTRPQMSYSLPAQLPDPDQHMHEVYMAAQAAAAANTTQVSGPLVL